MRGDRVARIARRARIGAELRRTGSAAPAARDQRGDAQPADQLPKTLPPGDPPAPKKKSGCGCATEGGEGAGLALVGGLGVAALVTRRRRR